MADLSNKLFDKRIVDRNVAKKLVTRADYDAKLAALPDVADNAAVVDLEEDEGPQAAPPAADPRASVQGSMATPGLPVSAGASGSVLGAASAERPAASPAASTPSLGGVSAASSTGSFSASGQGATSAATPPGAPRAEAPPLGGSAGSTADEPALATAVEVGQESGGVVVGERIEEPSEGSDSADDDSTAL